MKEVCAYEGWRGECYEQKHVTPATCTDHIIPHKGDKYLFWDPLNRQSLCDACHSKKTVREDGGFGHQASDTAPLGA
jgi:5-methylcytosine-specific restriction protein A